jgi:hypothetical protein
MFSGLTNGISALLVQPGFLKQRWVVFILVLGLLAVGCSAINSPSFDFVSGDEELVVLIRNQKDGNYRLRYDGRAATDLQSLQVMLGGQVLHVDVGSVVAKLNGQELELESVGSLPAGSQATLNPGDEFDVQVTFYGRTLGGNYMYGFRINTGDESSSEEVDVIAEYDYVIVVE